MPKLFSRHQNRHLSPFSSLFHRTALVFLIASAWTLLLSQETTHAQDKTGTNRFRQFEGDWFFFGLNPLSGAGLQLQDGSAGSNDFITETTVFSVRDEVRLKLKKKSVRTGNLRGTYEAVEDTFVSSLGESGRFSFTMVEGSKGQELRATFTPNGLPKVSSMAEREGLHPAIAKIVPKVRVRGSRKPGGTLRISTSLINRGPATIGPEGLTLSAGVAGDVESGNITTKGIKNFSSCGESSNRGVSYTLNCPVSYLGPPASQTIATIKYTVKLADTAGGSDFFIGANVDKEGNNNIDFRIKQVKFKIKDTKSDGGGSSGGLNLNGLFTRTYFSSSPPRTSTYRFSRSGSVINGAIVTLSAFEESVGYKVGDLAYRNFRKVGTSFEGEIANRIVGGRIEYVDVTLTPSGQSFVNRFGQTLLTKK